MYQVAPSVWNAIAQTQRLRNPSFRQLMSLPQDEMLTELDAQASQLEANGVPVSVINAYQQIAPLLAENEAISAYINQTGSSELRQALPEVLNAPEALAIADKDSPLSDPERAQLLKMLTPLEPATSLNA